MDERAKKIGVLSVCSIILLAMVVALTIGSLGGDEEKPPEISSSQKAITTICETTDYQTTCVDALKNDTSTNSTNPKDLIVVAFQATIRYINEAVEKSVLIQEAQSDPRAQSALESCRELSNRAAEDLHRSFEKFSGFDIINVDDILLELKIWLSGAITHQETCLDGFVGVQGDAGEKMRQALNTSMQMTSNSLAMVAEIATYLETMGIGGSQGGGSRRLLSEGSFSVLGHENDGLLVPEWMDFETRRLLASSPQQLKPHLIVAKDGSGKYTTINEALKDVPKKSNRTFVMYIKEGVYEEKVWFNSSLTHLMIVGDGPTKTRITGSLNFIDGTGTYRTATVAVQADDFIARDVGFENSAGAEKHQAVALRVSADKVIFFNCHMDGYQDTLYAHTYRQFYRDCVISGTIDFIFGDAAAVFQGCTLLVRKPMDNQQNIVTAQGRKDIRQPTGLVLQNCTFKADPDYFPFRQKLKTYLARPWKEYSRTIIMESFLDDLIQPQGWLPWNETFALETLFYTEFNNRGPGAPKAQRLKWTGVKELPPSRIKRFTAAEFLDANRWVTQTRVPFDPGFIFAVPKEDPNIKYSPVVPEETKDLGVAIDKAAYVAKVNATAGSPPIVIPPPPPPPPPPVPVSAPEIAIPMDILPAPGIAAAPFSESPFGSPISQPDDFGMTITSADSPTSSSSIAGASGPTAAAASEDLGSYSPSGSPQSSADEDSTDGILDTSTSASLSQSPALAPASADTHGSAASPTTTDTTNGSPAAAPTTSSMGSSAAPESTTTSTDTMNGSPAAAPTTAAAASPQPDSSSTTTNTTNVSPAAAPLTSSTAVSPQSESTSTSTNTPAASPSGNEGAAATDNVAATPAAAAAESLGSLDLEDASSPTSSST